MTRILSLILCTCLLAACETTMSKDDCQRGDWYAAGYEDGIDNAGYGNLEARAKACEKHGASPDNARYAEGYDAGFDAYCSPKGGYDQGVKGRSIDRSDVCPIDRRPEFLAGYQAGRELHNLREAVSSARSRVDGYAHTLDYGPGNIRDKKREIEKIKDKDIPQDEKDKRIDKLYDQIEDIHDDIDRAHHNIRDAERDLGRAEVRLEEYERYLRNNPPY